MKISKIIALITAIIFALVCSFSVSAANPMQNDVLYVDTNIKAYNSSTGVAYKQPSGTAHAFLRVKDYNNNPCYCIEFGAKFTRTRYKSVNLSNSSYWSSLSEVKREGIALISVFGYPAQSINELGVSSADDAYIATQSLITEYQTGIRTSPTNLTDLKYYNTIKGTPAETAYNHILADANEYISSSQYDGKTDELPGFVNFTSESGSEEQELICFYGTMPQVLSTGYIEIYKKNPDGVLLDGAEFKVYNSNGNYVTDIGPTINGYAKSNEISFGTYTVVETKAPENYDRGKQNQWTVTLDSDHVSVALDVINKHKSGFLKVIKTAEDQIVADCEFSLTGIDVYGRPVNMTAKTNNSGIAIFEDVPIGTGYELEEKSPPDRYLIPDKQTVDIKGDETAVVEIFNVLKKQFLKIQKCDTETGKIISLAGIGFKVKNTETGEFIKQQINSSDTEIFYTEEDGTVTLPEKLTYGNYEIIEYCTAEGYVLTKTPIPFFVDGSIETLTVTVNNTPQKGVIKIRKTGEVFSSVTQYNGEYIPFYKVEFLAGAVFEIVAAEDILTPDGTLRYKSGEIVDTVTTTKDGNAISKNLYLGKYIVKETHAPDGMVIDNEPKIVELIYAGQEAEVTQSVCNFFNERQKVVIRLIKELEKSFGLGEKEYGNVYFALYATENIIAADGSMIPKDAVIEIAQCDENGNLAFKSDLPVGSKIHVKEYLTDSNYKISGETYYFEFEYAGQNIKIVEISVNDGLPIKNELFRGSVIVKKTDEKGNPLTGVTFGLFKKDETVFTEKTALMLSISGEDGMFSFENVPYGEWIIHELKTVDGYTLTNRSSVINLNGDSPVVELTIVNEKITESPKTGQTVKIWPSIITLIASGVAVLALLAKNKKRKEN